jgi:hypothetical protein
MGLRTRTGLSGYVLVTMLTIAAASPAHTQALSAANDRTDVNIELANLPDAPSAVAAAGIPDPFAEYVAQPSLRTKPAKKFHRVVHPDQIAPPLTAGDKLELAIMSRLTFTDIFSTAFSAGLAQWRDGRPHYGVDEGAFGERLGGIALKQTTQSIFSYGLYAAAFHDDPRYYVMGDGHGFAKRAIYSATRLVITKKDDGSSAANWPKFAGVVSAAALSNAYYPQRDRGPLNTTYSVISSFGTSILNNEIHEFIGDAAKILHRKK